jgi:hypothetical protein
MNKEPDYERYNLRQLHEAQEYIDKEKYRDRYEKIQKCIKIKSTNPSEQDLQFLSELERKDKEQQNIKRNWKRPIIKGIYMLGIGISGLYSGVVYVENGNISYIDNPGLFVIYLLVLLGVGFHLVIEGLSKWERFKHEK